jgi:ABC-2 type transport system permease protein
MGTTGSTEPPQEPPRPEPPQEPPQEPPRRERAEEQPQQEQPQDERPEGQAPPPDVSPSPPRRPLERGSRRLRRGAASGVYTVTVLAILVVANAIGAQFHRTWDLTASHRYTLSQASVGVLRQIKQPIQLLAFLQPGSSTGGQIKQLLSEYQTEGGGRVSYRVVDPGVHPATARRYGVTEYDTVVVVSGGATALVLPQDMYTYGAGQQPVFEGEQAITSGILRAVNPQHLAVYFVTGNGEQATNGNYSAAASALTGEGYTVNTINLLAAGTVPHDASAVVVAGPQQDLSPQEIQTLSVYAKSGGHVLVMLDPTASPLPARLVALLGQWGVGVEHDLVVDPAANYHLQFDPRTLIPAYGSSPITSPLQSSNLPTVLPGALSLKPQAKPPYQVTVLLQTSAQGWGKTDLKNSSLTFTSGDLKGPLDLGVSVSSPGASGARADFRAVVLGSSFFAGNQFISVQGNRNLFLNAVSWLSGRTQGITIRPTAAANRSQVFLGGGAASSLFFGLVILLPLLCFAGAAVVWSMRRRL